MLALGTAHAKVLTPSAPVGICPLMLRLRKGEWVDKRLSHSLGRGSGTDSMKFFFSSLMLAWCFFISSCVLSRSYQQNGRISEGTQRDLGLPKLCLAKLRSAELLTTSPNCVHSTNTQRECLLSYSLINWDKLQPPNRVSSSSRTCHWFISSYAKPGDSWAGISWIFPKWDFLKLWDYISSGYLM